MMTMRFSMVTDPPAKQPQLRTPPHGQNTPPIASNLSEVHEMEKTKTQYKQNMHTTWPPTYTFSMVPIQYYPGLEPWGEYPNAR